MADRACSSDSPPVRPTYLAIYPATTLAHLVHHSHGRLRCEGPWHVNMSSMAARKVLQLPELLTYVLLNFDMETLLLSQRVNGYICFIVDDLKEAEERLTLAFVAMADRHLHFAESAASLVLRSFRSNGDSANAANLLRPISYYRARATRVA